MNQTQTALITGASSGLGYEFSQLAATDGHDLIVVARDKNVLEEIASRIRGACRVTVNVIAQLTRLILPHMIARKHTGGFSIWPQQQHFNLDPFMAAYYASKAYVLSLTAALAEELRGSGVTATALCPGPVRTKFQIRAGIQETFLVNSPLVMDAPTVARIGYKAMLAGKRVCVPGALNAMMAFAARISPISVSARIARRLQESPSQRS